MKRIAAWTTSDGVVHTSKREADSHADKRYGKALTGLAAKLLMQPKYILMTSFLDENLPMFAELIALKKDMELEKGDDDADD